MAVLAVNTGSSSLKFAVFNDVAEPAFLRGSVSAIGTPAARMIVHRGEAAGQTVETDASAIDDGTDAAARVLSVLEEEGLGTLGAVGHRIVHGGTRFVEPARVDAPFLRELRSLDSLAPLHNPPARRVLEALARALPDVAQIAVFDTAFHTTLPEYAYRYALPEWVMSQHGVRRFGFHGTSHRYLAARVGELVDAPVETLRLVTLHLGNGASVAAVRGGRCVDTSMGFTPLEGLVMGTRCGDLDASVPPFLQAQADLSAGAVDKLLNEQSGLLGVAGVSDMRQIETRRRDGDPAATLAFDMFCYRAKKYLGAYVAALGGVDAIVFAGGIGERSAAVRAAICSDLEELGIVLDSTRNAAASPDALVQARVSRAAIAVIATDEEREIARQALALLEGSTCDEGAESR